MATESNAFPWFQDSKKLADYFVFEVLGPRSITAGQNDIFYFGIGTPESKYEYDCYTLPGTISTEVYDGFIEELNSRGYKVVDCIKQQFCTNPPKITHLGLLIKFQKG